MKLKRHNELKGNRPSPLFVSVELIEEYDKLKEENKSLKAALEKITYLKGVDGGKLSAQIANEALEENKKAKEQNK